MNTELSPPPALQLRPLLENALREDLRSGDITTNAIFDAAAQGEAVLKSREDGVLCGAEIARQVFALLDENIACDSAKRDGETLRAGDEIARLRGRTRALLSGERVALNFAQRLSGIATLTRKFVDAAASTRGGFAPLRIADTRKTTPGLRLLERYAVRCGGGYNHRYALDDLILIKDNHIALCGGVKEAIERARQNASHAVKIEVECDTLAQVEEAVTARADILLLDNMDAETLRRAVEIVDGRAVTEASGGVNLESVAGIAASGVDVVSIGALTHAARALDLGLDVD